MINLGTRSCKQTQRVLRGGSWNNNGRNCRSAIRNNNTAGYRNDNNGFRLALAHNTIGIRIIDQIIAQLYCAQHRYVNGVGAVINKPKGHRMASSRGSAVKVLRLAAYLGP